MVYSLNWSPSGNLLAAGLGDGNVNIFAIENRNLVQTGLLPDGHDSSVASVLFPSFCDNKTERVLFSGGSDGTVLCWDLGANVCHKSTSTASKHPQDLFAPSLLQEQANSKSMDGLIKQTEELSLDKPQILFGIGNGDKINWMETSQSPSTLFVADTTNDITAYSIPLIQ
jgi:WD40 repeat protein